MMMRAIYYADIGRLLLIVLAGGDGLLAPGLIIFGDHRHLLWRMLAA